MSGSTSSCSSPSLAGSTDAVFRPLALLFAGACLIFLVGFAPLSALHNAAHDTRHSAAFPCH